MLDNRKQKTKVVYVMRRTKELERCARLSALAQASPILSGIMNAAISIGMSREMSKFKPIQYADTKTVDLMFK